MSESKEWTGDVAVQLKGGSVVRFRHFATAADRKGFAWATQTAVMSGEPIYRRGQQVYISHEATIEAVQVANIEPAEDFLERIKPKPAPFYANSTLSNEYQGFVE